MYGKKKILYISYDGLTDPLGRSQIIPYLLGIAFAGYEVTVLSCEKRSAYKHKKKIVKKILKLSNIKWKKKFYTKKPAVISTIWDVFCMRLKANALHSKQSFHIVHCRSLLGALIGKKLQDEHTKLVFDMRGFWVDERVEGGIWNIKKKLYHKIFNYFKELENHFFENSDHIVSLTQKAKSHVLKVYKERKDEEISVIPCSVELMLFDSENVKTELVREKKKLLGISPDDFVLGYIGSLGTRYMADEMLEFFAVLRKSIPQSKFLLISNSGEEEMLAKAKKMDMEHVLIYYKADYAEIPLMLSLFNAAVYFIKTGFSGMAVSPTKQAEILAMGKPIVSNNGIGDSDKIFAESGCGILVPDFSENSFGKAVQELNVLLKKKPQEFRKLAEEHFSMKEAVAKYLAAYKQLT